LFEGVEETLISATAQDMVFGTDGAVVATVTPSEAPGTVEVADGHTVIGLAELEDGEATVTIPGDALEAGTHTLDVRYLGADGFTPSETQVEITVTLPPLEAELAIDPIGAVNNQTGEATVSGTIECSRAADYSFEVEVEQRFGRFQALGSTTVEGSCSGDGTVTWSASLASRTSLRFGPGHVSVRVEGVVDDAATAPVPIAATEPRVRLTPAG